MTDDEQLQRTVRCLELMDESYSAFKAGDLVRCDALIAQAVEQDGVTFVLLRGGMTIGEIPRPWDNAFEPYVDEQRARLSQPTDTKEA